MKCDFGKLISLGVRLSLFVAAFVALSGCVRIDIGDRKPTLGEEIRELAALRSSGVVSDEEHDKLRKQVIRKLIY